MSDDEDEDHVLQHPEHDGERDPACSLCQVAAARPKRKNLHTGGTTDGVTLEVIGKELGVTRERVRQIERKAMVKALKACKRLGVKLADVLDLERDGPTSPAGPWD